MCNAVHQISSLIVLRLPLIVTIDTKRLNGLLSKYICFSVPGSGTWCYSPRVHCFVCSLDVTRNGCRAHAQRQTLELGSSCSWTLRQEGAIQSGNSISAESAAYIGMILYRWRSGVLEVYI
ncbi:unnamed protein product [Caretta caretta]